MPAGDGATAGMIWINGGSFTMGDNRTYPEERPAERVTVSGFWIDRHEVTNAQFRRFVEATGYVTMAERGLNPKEHPGLPPKLTMPGSMLFTSPSAFVTGPTLPSGGVICRRGLATSGGSHQLD